ncbi:TetR/AcrR family transcriptional regulator [Hugenholtzia roseola]|uniref:TetR/AcrR family transcriptional regulator n=1 Tax=Hugenholtzia roseola TaxID=1002 RepID=UPI001FE0DC4D|nr:TetR/AcrR family transcriptional regulator [Hugenholtzia roseola]
MRSINDSWSVFLSLLTDLYLFLTTLLVLIPMGVLERKAKEKKIRKKAIVDAAEKIFFTQGMDKATMADVAREAELSKGTLYLYFKSKEELYKAIILRAFRVLKRLLRAATDKAKSGYDNLIALTQAYVNFAFEYPNYFNTILDYQNENFNLDGSEPESIKTLEEGNSVMEILINVLRQGIKDGSLFCPTDPSEAAFVLWGQLTGVLQVIKRKMQIIHHYFSISREDMLKTYFHYLEKTLRINPL